jgi:UDP-N-acetyl-D-galactosamine dehydrogenase
MMVKKEINVKNARCLILGFTFKENCPDVRNTKVIDIVKELKNYHVTLVIFDPWANPNEVQHEYGIEVVNEMPIGNYESAILAVSHNEFKGINIRSLLIDNGVLFDVKGLLEKGIADARL